MVKDGIVLGKRYAVLSKIGAGGMADVYKAKDTILNRIVAIKVLRDKLSGDAMALVRFQREASAASRLSHPNVVDIYDVGEYKGHRYIVMEYVRGQLAIPGIALPEAVRHGGLQGDGAVREQKAAAVQVHLIPGQLVQFLTAQTLLPCQAEDRPLRAVWVPR